MLLAWVAIMLHQGSRARAIDLRDRCRPQETGRCFSDRSGRVESIDFNQVEARYDDGRKTKWVTLAADSTPSVGERARLESWEGEVVSLFIPARQRRYHTSYWTRRLDPYSLWVGAIAGLALLFGAAAEG